MIPAAENLAPTAMERRSDVTILYHLKAETKPFSTAVFRENIGITPGPDEDWRWSIVEAKGVRPSQTPATYESQREEPLFAMPSALLPSDNQPPAPGASTAPTVPLAPAAPLAIPDKPEKKDSSTTNTIPLAQQ